MHQVNFKLTNGFMPEKKTTGAGAYDLYSAVDMILKPKETGLIKLGFHTSFSKDLVAVIRDRSSLAVKGFFVTAGVIDSDYRGEWMIVMNNRSVDQLFEIKRGERIAQVLFLNCPETSFKLVQDLDDSERGEGGFGSTNK